MDNTKERQEHMHYFTTDQLFNVTTDYRQALLAYQSNRTKANYDKLAKLYSKLSSAQWEVEQYSPKSE